MDKSFRELDFNYSHNMRIHRRGITIRGKLISLTVITLSYYSLLALERLSADLDLMKSFAVGIFVKGGSPN